MKDIAPAIKHMKQVERYADDYYSRFARVSSDLEKNLEILLTKKDITGSVDVAITKSEIDQILVESGYYDEVNSLLGDTYNGVLRESYQQYKEMYKDKFRFAEGSIARMDAMKQLDFGSLSAVANDLSTEVNRAVLGMQTGALTKPAAIERIKEILRINIGTTNSQGYAQTIVQDGIMSFYNTANTQLAIDNGLEYFKYSGTLIKTSRDFCVNHLHEIHTLDEWQEIADSEGVEPGPFVERRGGYNCRHHLVAVA